MDVESPTEAKYSIFCEGNVKIAVGADAQTFYNPVQEFNRDLTVLVLRQFVEDRREDLLNASSDVAPPAKRLRHQPTKLDEKIRILDALSASGLRALRFSREVPDVDFVVANDFSDDAVEAIKRNAKLNGLEHLIRPSYGDAVDAMMSHRKFDKRFHVIDLDPYGSAATFLDSAVQAVSDGGLLMVTCTDTATLCGNTPEACFNKYSSVPLRHKCCHEFALRILLKCIDSHAARHGRYIVPLLSVSIDFYVRCFVKIFTSVAKAKDSVTKLAHVRACTSCKSLEFQPLVKKSVAGTSIRFTNAAVKSEMLSRSEKSTSNDTEPTNGGDKPADDVKVEKSKNDDKNGDTREVGSLNSGCAYCGVGPIHLAGPIYVDPLHDTAFVQKLLNRINGTTKERLATHDRLAGLLTVVSEEIHEVPLYYEYDQLMNVVRSSVPRQTIFRSAILNAGYNCSISHCNPCALKTNAPISFLWDVCCAWAKQNKAGNSNRLENYPAARNLLARSSSATINFSLNPAAMAKSKSDCLLRFPDNKGKNWGPKSKAKGSVTSNTASYQPAK